MALYLIILLYTALFAFFIYSCKFFTLKYIAKPWLLVLFFIKVIVAFSYIYIMRNHVTAGDIFNYYQDGLIVFDYLKNGEIITYLQLSFGTNNTEITPAIAQAVNDMGYWYDSSSYIQVRLNALFNVFTWGQSIYANALFFAFISFTAAVLLVKTFQEFLSSSTLLNLFIFLSPSLLFWTTGMHKESVSVFLIALILFSFLAFTKYKQFKYLVLITGSFILLFFLRYFIAALLIVPLAAYTLYVVHNKYKPILYFGFTYLVASICLYFLPLVFNKPNIIDLINNKKELYLALKKGNTAIDLGDYSLSYIGYMMKTPQALVNTTIRPFFSEANTFFLQLASIESLIISVLLVLSLYYLRKIKQSEQAILFVLYSFSISYLILAGLIVPNIGAILRYRSVALFLLVPSSIFIISQAFFKKSEKF